MFYSRVKFDIMNRQLYRDAFRSENVVIRTDQRSLHPLTRIIHQVVSPGKGAYRLVWCGLGPFLCLHRVLLICMRSRKDGELWGKLFAVGGYAARVVRKKDRVSTVTEEICIRITWKWNIYIYIYMYVCIKHIYVYIGDEVGIQILYGLSRLPIHENRLSKCGLRRFDWKHRAAKMECMHVHWCNETCSYWKLSECGCRAKSRGECDSPRLLIDVDFRGFGVFELPLLMANIIRG